MHRHLTPRALERAQWFADLSTALAEAEKVLALLECAGNFPAETIRLRNRIEAIRTELAQLNRVILGEGRVVGRDWPAAKAGGA
jgi:hypothetical protein